MISQCNWCDSLGQCTCNHSALNGVSCEERGCPFYSVGGGITHRKKHWRKVKCFEDTYYSNARYY